MFVILLGLLLTSAKADVSPQLIEAVKEFEGYSRKAYWDYAQCSIGWGTRATSCDEEIEEEEADSRLIYELEKAQAEVDSLEIYLPEGMRNALTSLTYNAGPSWKKAGLGAAIRSGDWIMARCIFLRYIHAGGDVLPGLVKRRKAEAAWFEVLHTDCAPPEGKREKEVQARRKTERVADNEEEEKPKRRRKRRKDDDDDDD